MPANIRDTLHRFRVMAADHGDTWFQFNLGRQAWRNQLTRFKLSIAQPATVWRMTVSRYRLVARSYINARTRFRTRVVAFNDIRIRFQLKVARDTVTRLRLWGRSTYDFAFRFYILAPSRDTVTRFLIQAIYRHTQSRFRVIAGYYRDTSTRITIAAFNYEHFANNAFSFLSQALTATSSQTIFSVQNTALFPSRGYFRILVDSEIMIVQKMHGNQLSVTRGAEGTAVAAHFAGANVYHIVTAGALQNLYSEPILDSSGAFIYDSGTGDILVGRPYP